MSLGSSSEAGLTISQLCVSISAYGSPSHGCGCITTILFQIFSVGLRWLRVSYIHGSVSTASWHHVKYLQIMVMLDRSMRCFMVALGGFSPADQWQQEYKVDAIWLFPAKSLILYA